MMMSDLHAVPHHDDGRLSTMRDGISLWYKATLLIPFFVMLFLRAVLDPRGRNLALKGGLIGGGVFGIVILASVYMCWRLGYIQALMENEPSGKQGGEQGGQKEGEEKKEQHGPHDVEMGRMEGQQQQHQEQQQQM